jgi:FtsP/CotA-like multicopper oxidase with cupredoxin domain
MGLWTVNGEFMDPTKISAAPKQGTAEIWTFRNAGSSWAHPVHVHFEEFQVLEWNGKPPTGVLRSRKDVAVLGPNDTCKAFYRFDDFLGSFVIHCHNNVHEDNAMMLRWDIVPNGGDGGDDDDH